jgi:hypothetical protein
MNAEVEYIDEFWELFDDFSFENIKFFFKEGLLLSRLFRTDTIL